MANSEDIQFMRAALALARRGLGRTAPNPAVGCILVKKGVVIARGWTGDGGRPHAETIALHRAARAAKGATAYVSLEPCSHTGQTGPCAQALIDAGVVRVVVACGDPDPRVSGRGVAMLRAAGIDVIEGVCADEARALNVGFMLKVGQGRPFITLKVATSADGKIAPLAGKTRWITGEMARRHVHLERSKHDAILVGIGTILQDNPMLTTRLEGVTHKSVRIVLDSHLRIPPASKLVSSASEAPLWVFYKSDTLGIKRHLEDKNVRLFEGGTDVKTVVRTLAGEGLTRVFVEGGGKVHRAFAEAGLGDELLWYRGPQPMGGIEAFGGMQKVEILSVLGLEHAETRALGEDLLEIYGRSA